MGVEEGERGELAYFQHCSGRGGHVPSGEINFLIRTLRYL